MHCDDDAIQTHTEPTHAHHVGSDHPGDAEGLPRPAGRAAELIRTRSTFVNPDSTIDQYLPRCQEIWTRTLDEHGSMDGYQSVIDLHIIPFFTGTRIAEWDSWLIGRFVEHLAKKVALTAKGTPFKDERKLSRDSILRILAVLSGICSIAMGDGITKENPAKNYGRQLNRHSEHGSVRAKPIPKQKALTVQERDRVLTAVRTVLDLRYSTYYYVLAGTGVRPSEAAALRWEHVDLEGQTTGGVPVVYIRCTFKRDGKHIGKTKSGRWRTVELHPTLVQILTKLKATVPDNPKARVFTRPNGRPFSQSFRNYVWALVLGLAGIERWLPVYCLRHTYASILINNDVSITFVSLQLGHSSDEVTRVNYLNWLPVKSNPSLSRLDLKAG